MNQVEYLPEGATDHRISFHREFPPCGARAFFGFAVSPRYHLQREKSGKFLRVFFGGLKPAFRARLCYNGFVSEGLYREFEFAPLLPKPLTRDPDETKPVKAAPNKLGGLSCL